MSCIDAVDVRQQHQCVGLHHAGNEAGKLVVVGKHQLSDAHCVVLIDHGQHAVLQHHGHAGPLVLILFAGLKVLLHCEHLPDADVILPEEVVVQPDKLHLSECGEQLSLLH